MPRPLAPFLIRHYGAEGLRAHIRRHVAFAQEFAGGVAADDRCELAAPAPLNLVCFRHVAGDEATQRLPDDRNASGRLYLTPARLDGRLVLRRAIGGTYTERRHVESAWQLIREQADAVATGSGMAR